MKIAYLLNTYPTTSQTFIRREIEGLEAKGVEIIRYAIRRWPEALVEEQDRAEQLRTRYVLSDRTIALILVFFVEFLTNPIGVFRALGLWMRLIRNSGGRIIAHTAYLLEAASVRRWASRDGVGVLHTHYLTNATAVALLCQSLGGPPFSISVHGPEELDSAKLASLKEKLQAARFVALISNFTRAQVARIVGMSAWNKLHVVRCGIELAHYPVSHVSFKDNLTFVCVGRLCIDKAQTLVVEAMATVTKRHPNARLLLVGDGETRKHVEATIAKHGLQQNVTMLGWQTNAQVRQLIGSARALVLPSFSEGLPIVIIEALALGRPVVTTFVAGIPELIDRDCGWIIPAGSVENVAQAMIDAIETSPDKLTEMGLTGRHRVVETHDIHKNTAQLWQLLTGRQLLPNLAS